VTAKITLTWDNGSSEHVDQIVYRSTETFTSSNLPPILARVGRNAREYIDTDIVTGNVYFYAVASENAVGEILLSSVISVTAGGAGRDPHWDKVVSLLHFDGDLTDETGRIWQLRGLVEASGDEYKFGGSSLFFPTGSRDGLYHEHSADFALSTDDYTIEFFAYFLDEDPRVALDIGTASGWYGRFFIDRYEGKLRVAGGTSVTSWIENGDIPINSWVHIAVTIQAGQLFGFLNGLLVGSSNVTGQLPTGNLAVGIGHVLPQTNPANMYGYIDELRITKGVARYTENFTPPTEPFPNY